MKNSDFEEQLDKILDQYATWECSDHDPRRGGMSLTDAKAQIMQEIAKRIPKEINIKQLNSVIDKKLYAKRDLPRLVNSLTEEKSRRVLEARVHNKAIQRVKQNLGIVEEETE